ncbi:MAG: HAD hydrolase family protein [Coriobacteriales bacterium]|nr:HAD hydrolase family protein [Coriobacteriales bacterium]
MRKTAFASDFDGTLCESDWNLGIEHFDPANLEAVRAYQAAGGLFGICTGRPLTSIVDSMRGRLELDFYIVTTGAQVLDGRLDPIVVREIDLDVVAGLHERFAREDMGFIVVTETQFASVGGPAGPGIDPIRSVGEVRPPVYDVSLEYLDDEDAARTACAQVNEQFGNAVAAFQNRGSVDIVPAGCSKGSGVRAVREALGVDCIAGIGDSYNDLPLLEAADVSYTFYQAPEEVRVAADHVVGSVAQALEHFMSLP